MLAHVVLLAGQRALTEVDEVDVFETNVRWLLVVKVRLKCFSEEAAGCFFK
jgi:hypothetical protein